MTDLHLTSRAGIFARALSERPDPQGLPHEREGPPTVRIDAVGHGCRPDMRTITQPR